MRVLLVSVVVVTTFCLHLVGATVTKADNNDPLDSGSSWVGGAVPDALSEALWDSIVTGANNSSLNADAVWNGIKVTNPGGPITISGSSELYLDGGAANDIDLTAATQDLTVETPVKMAGNFIINVAELRKLTFNEVFSYSADGTSEIRGGGTVVIKAPVLSDFKTTFEIEDGTAILAGADSSLQLPQNLARLYVGRNSGSGTLIVSNGVHFTGSVNSVGDANFVGVGAGTWGCLIIEGGYLRMDGYLRVGVNSGDGELVVNNGTLDVTSPIFADGEILGTADYALMLGNQYQDSNFSVNSDATLTVNGGAALFTNGIVKIGSDHVNSTGLLQVNLNGGVLGLKRFIIGASTKMTKVVNLNGGILRLTGNGSVFDGPGAENGSLTVLIGNDGAIIETVADDVVLDTVLQADGTGGLTKSGSGKLTVKTVCTYTGTTRVSAGLLCFAEEGLMSTPNLAVASYAGISLADGTFSTFAPLSLIIGNPLSAAIVELELERAGNNSDVLALPLNTTLGRIAFSPVLQGTTERAERPGDYVVLTYIGAAPDTSLFSVYNPASDRQYSFILDENAQSVILRIEYADYTYEWLSSGSGNWQHAANWTAVPPSTSGTVVKFGSAALAPAAITASTPVTLGGLMMDNLNAYTFAGSVFTFDNGIFDAYLNSVRGSHIFDAPLQIENSVVVDAAADTMLTISGTVSGSGRLTKSGAGELALTSTNNHSGGTTLSAGTLRIADGYALGTAPFVSTGADVVLKTDADISLLIENNFVMDQSLVIDTFSSDMELSGNLQWNASGLVLSKTGSHELSVSGSSTTETEYVKVRVDNGTLRFKSGADINWPSTYERDVIDMNLSAPGNSAVIIEEGAQVALAGIVMNYGDYNTVTVNGGVLNLLGGRWTCDAVLMRNEGIGTDRFIINSGNVTLSDEAWFNVGVRQGDAYLTINGGTGVLSRVSLGARLESLAFPANSIVEINDGLLEVPGTFNWMGSGYAARINTVTLGNGIAGGGIWRLCATINPQLIKGGAAVLNFNGGTLEMLGLAAYGDSTLDDYLYGATQIYVDAGGARIDTCGLNATISQALQPRLGTDGGLTKLGEGTLSLTGSCSFTGPTVIEAGTLRLPATYASSALQISEGATLSLVNGSYDELTLSSAAFASGSILLLEAAGGGASCDCITLPADADMGALKIAVLDATGGATVRAPGDYQIFTFSGAAPSISDLILLNPPMGRVVNFVIDGNAIVLRLTSSPGSSLWTLDGSGSWEVSDNWTTPPANTPGAEVRLDDSIVVPATVSLAASSTMSLLAFNNQNSYTVDGAALMLANTGGVPAVVASEYGSHTINSDVNAVADLSVLLGSQASLLINGDIVADELVLSGPGTLSLPAIPEMGVTSLGFAYGATLALTNSHVTALPVNLYGIEGGALDIAAGHILDITGSVAGSGGITKYGAESVMTITNASATFTGAAAVYGGTLLLDTLPDNGLVLGGGTLRYIGEDAVINGGYWMQADSDVVAGILETDSDITFQGNVSADSGAWIKRGSGTLYFTAEGVNHFNAGNGAGTGDELIDFREYGDSPALGFSGFNIVDGKVVIGTVGQTNFFGGDVVVGLNSTALTDAETAGEFEIVGGVNDIKGELIIGRNNGTTASAANAVSSRLRITGGDTTVGSLIFGRSNSPETHNSAPHFEMTGGILRILEFCYFNEQQGASTTINLSGGRMEFYGGANAVRSLRCCELGGHAEVTISGDAELYATRRFFLCFGSGSTTVLNLDGGTLITQYISMDSAGDSGIVKFNGGVYRPTQNSSLVGLTAALVGSGGAVFDLSEVDLVTIRQSLDHDESIVGNYDGGLIKTGSGILDIAAAQGYNGPTVIMEGTLQVSEDDALSTAGALTMAPGTELLFDGSNFNNLKVSALTLGDAAEQPVELIFMFADDGLSHDVLSVSGTLTLGAVSFNLSRMVNSAVFSRNGVYTLMTYVGADPDVSGLVVANPLTGKSYVFSASDGALKLTIASDLSGSSYVWQAVTGGSWESSLNWALAPGAGDTGVAVRFDETITSPAVVRLANAVKLGELYFNSLEGYSLTGSSLMSIDNGATQALFAVERGAHTLALPLQIAAGGVDVSVPVSASLTLAEEVAGEGVLTKSGAGVLSIGGAGTRSGSTDLREGSLILCDGASLGSGDLILNDNTAVRTADSAAPITLDNKMIIMNNATLDAAGSDLVLSGMLDWRSVSGTLLKTGTNQLVFAGCGRIAGGSPRIRVMENGITFASGANYALDGATRESVRIGSAITNTMMTIEEGAEIVAGGFSASGISSASTGEALMLQNGGDVKLVHDDALFVRHNGLHEATYVMNGGTLSMPQTSWANVGLYGPGRIVVNNGRMQIGRFASGYQNRDFGNNDGLARVFINGGHLDVTGSWSWFSDQSVRRYTLLALNGGVLTIPSTAKYGVNLTNWSELILSDGLLELRGAALDSSTLNNYFNGLDRVALEGSGGILNTMGRNIAIKQGFLSRTSTAGLTKIGGGRLTLEGTNVLWGTVDVQEGTLCASLTHHDLPAVPLLWLGMNSFANPDISGHQLPVSVVKNGSASTTRKSESDALEFDGGGGYEVPYKALYQQVTNYTLSVWLRVTESFADAAHTIISARSGNYRAMDIKLRALNVRLLHHSYADQTWWQEIRSNDKVPLNEWAHVAVTITPEGVAMYINGVKQWLTQYVGSNGSTPQPYLGGWPYEGDLSLKPGTLTAGLTIGRTTPTHVSGFKGSMDELMLFDRALSDAEIMALSTETPAAPLSVRTGTMGTLEMNGETLRVTNASGEGYFTEGTLLVEGSLAPGDSDRFSSGAVLNVDNLTLSSNVVYQCTVADGYNDRVDVNGLLTIVGSGAIDLGRSEANPLNGSHSITVMTYDSITGAEKLKDWSVTGIGRSGYAVSITAIDGEVVLDLESRYSTLLIVR